MNRLENTFFLSEASETVGEGDGLVFLRTNGSGSKVYGAEVNADLQWTDFIDFEVGWTFQRSRLDEPEPEFGLQQFYRFPESYGYVAGRYIHPRFSVGTIVSFTGGMWLKHYAGFIPEDRVETTPGFTVVDLRGEMPIYRAESRISLVMQLFNLFDVFQEDLDRGPEKHSGYVYGPRRPRTFASGLKFDF